MYVAYADRKGVIGFCHQTIAPAGTIVFTGNDDLEALKKRVIAKARYAHDDQTLLVPGVPKAGHDGEAFDALKKWQQRAFPTDTLHIVEGTAS